MISFPSFSAAAAEEIRRRREEIGFSYLPAWAALMAQMRRKTLIVCATCHERIHANPVAHAA